MPGSASISWLGKGRPFDGAFLRRLAWNLDLCVDDNRAIVKGVGV
jgi:hypothetical protein